MNALIFLAGIGAGILVTIVITSILFTHSRRVTKEQREVNDRAFTQMEEGNRLRERRAGAMDRIANSLEILVERK